MGRTLGLDVHKRFAEVAVVEEDATNVKLVSLDIVGERTEKRVPDAGSVKDKVEVAAEGQSDVVSVSATDRDPRLAAQIANTFAQEYIAFRREADRAKIAEAQNLVESRLEDLDVAEEQGMQGRSLASR